MEREMKPRTYASLEEYRACVESYYKQLGPYVRHAHLSANSLFLVFISNAIARVWLEKMLVDLCCVTRVEVLEQEEGHQFIFFAGGSKKEWNQETRHKIRRWFVERAPDVRLWGE